MLICGFQNDEKIIFFFYLWEEKEAHKALLDSQ